MSEKPFSINESIKRVEEIASKLEHDEIGLEESIALYSEGMKLIKKVSAEIQKAEVEILKLTPENVIEGEDEEFE